MTDLVLVDELGIRLGLYGDIDATEIVEKNHDISFRICKAQENPVSFEKMSVSA